MSKYQPTESELEILQLLWPNGPMTVRAVNDILNKNKDVGYTTTLKIMQIMLEKKLVIRDESKRTHVYEAKVAESEVQEKLLSKFINSAFRGSPASLVMQALGNHSASAEELEEIKALIDRIENNKNPE